jgi:putative FmdB family regulatory protein
VRGVVELPLYEYKCAKCGKRFEKIEGFSAPETQKCPKCGGRAERQIAAPAIQFKGSGWYVTDYGGKGAAPKSSGEGSGDGGAAKAAEKNSGSKTDSKSDSKSESKPAASDNSNKGAAKRKR